MNRSCILSALFIVLSFVACHSAGDEGEDLLSALDADLACKEQFLAERQQSIDSLKVLRSQCRDTLDIYAINLKLTDEYLTFLCDSALDYALQNERIATQLGDTFRVHEMQIRLLQTCSMAGMFMDIPEVVHLRKVSDCTPDQRFSFCWAMINYCEHLAIYYAGNTTKVREYEQRTLCYRDTLIQMLPEGSGMRLKEEAFVRQAKGDAEGALQMLLPLVDDEPPGTRLYGLNSGTLARLYHDIGDSDAELRHLAIAADMDVRYGVCENQALFSLAQLMYARGDYNRAYLYATNAIDDAQYYNSRYRFKQITGIYSVIKNSYLQELHHHERMQAMLNGGLVLLTLMLVLGLLMLVHERRRLAQARASLHESVRDLADANARLDEAAKVREYYIAYLINLSSTYAEKLEEYRKTVFRKLKARQYDDLQKQSSRSLNDTLEEVFQQFDRTFLSLYPTFIADFNALLSPEYRYSPHNTNLCTEQRIFALYRFGMTDTAQIASFLHYSTQTIYNYRYRVKQHALDREHFEDDVMHIGSI